MSDLVDRYQNLLKTGFEYAEQDKGSAPTSNFEIYMGHFASLFSEIHTALSEAEQRVKNARREAVEEAVAIAKTVSDDLSMAELHPERRIAQRIYKSIRALIPSEPHDAEGRE